MAEVAQTQNADHPFALIDHRQSAHLKLLHVPHCFSEVIIIPTAMDARRHHIARRRAAGLEAILRQAYANDVAVCPPFRLAGLSLQRVPNRKIQLGRTMVPNFYSCSCLASISIAGMAVPLLNLNFFSSYRFPVSRKPHRL
jgi:hypothetical protein